MVTLVSGLFSKAANKPRVNEDTLYNDPLIVDIRKIVQTINTNKRKGKFEKQSGVDCDSKTYMELYIDNNKVVRYYGRKSLGEDFLEIINQYYDEKGDLRYAYILIHGYLPYTNEKVRREYWLYFDANEKMTLTIQSSGDKVSQRKYNYPTIDPVDKIVIKSPLEDFQNHNCPEE